MSQSSTQPKIQLCSRAYCRLFAESIKQEPLIRLLHAFRGIVLQRFSAFHSTLDFRAAILQSFLAYYHLSFVILSRLT